MAKQKHLKMFLYGLPGTGKSTFASKFPKPFFICTDGNFEWLDLPEKDHVCVYSWADCLKAFNDDYSGYDTIVVDLVEDVYRLCEADYCKRNKIDYVGNKGYGEGWRVVRDTAFLEFAKLLNAPKNVIFISHQTTYNTTDKRGVQSEYYAPNKRMSDDLIDQIEGRVRYFLRCYVKEDLVGNKFVKKRYLSLVPKDCELGIARGLDESSVPTDIELDVDTFFSVIGFNRAAITEATSFSKESEAVLKKEEEAKTEELKPDIKEDVKPEVKQEEKTETKAEEKVEVKQEQTTEQPVKESKEDKLRRLREKYGIK